MKGDQKKTTAIWGVLNALDSPQQQIIPRDTSPDQVFRNAEFATLIQQLFCSGKGIVNNHSITDNNRCDEFLGTSVEP